MIGLSLGELLTALGVEFFSGVDDPFPGILEPLQGSRAVGYSSSAFAMGSLFAETQFNPRQGLLPESFYPDLFGTVDPVTGVPEELPVPENQQRPGSALDAIGQFGAAVALEGVVNFLNDLSGGQSDPGRMMRGSYSGNLFPALGGSESRFAEFFGEFASSLSGGGEFGSNLVSGLALFG